MKNVRMGIVGMGNMGKYHANYLQAGKINGATLAAVSDSHTANLEPYKSIKTFESAEAMIRSGEIDAVLIATPHFLHTTIGIDALKNGKHVLVEKPISVHKADCQRLLDAHTDKKLIFSAMFQSRTEGKWKKIKHLIDEGELGKIVRTNWIVTDWFRTEAYYASGGWRATWKGEGGGVLLNQCPHNLDIMQWLCGRPSKVRGFCQLGRYHDIEVEDNVTAYLEYPNGGMGSFITSTGEAPGTNRFEIIGDNGKIVVEHGKVSFTRNEIPMMQFSKNARTGFAKPEIWNVEIPIENSGGKHEDITQNFVDAILQGTPLIAPAEEGVWSVELANAILYSSLIGQTVDLPLDAAAYEKKLSQLIAESKFEKKVVKVANEDFTKSFSGSR